MAIEATAQSEQLDEVKLVEEPLISSVPPIWGRKSGMAIMEYVAAEYPVTYNENGIADSVSERKRRSSRFRSRAW